MTEIHGDNKQGWQTAYNSIREEVIRTLGFANFDDVPLDGKRLSSPDLPDFGDPTNTLSGILDEAEDYTDIGAEATASSTNGGSGAFSEDWLSGLIPPDGWGLTGIPLDVPWIDTECATASCAEAPVYHGHDGVAAFFNNIKDFFEDNWTWIIVVIIAFILLTAMYVLRRRSASVSDEGLELSL